MGAITDAEENFTLTDFADPMPAGCIAVPMMESDLGWLGEFSIVNMVDREGVRGELFLVA